MGDVKNVFPPVPSGFDTDTRDPLAVSVTVSIVDPFDETEIRLNGGSEASVSVESEEVATVAREFDIESSPMSVRNMNEEAFTGMSSCMPVTVVFERRISAYVSIGVS